MAGSHDLADIRCRRTVRLSFSRLCGTVPPALPFTLMRLRARWTHRPDGHGAAVVHASLQVVVDEGLGDAFGVGGAEGLPLSLEVADPGPSRCSFDEGSGPGADAQRRWPGLAPPGHRGTGLTSASGSRWPICGRGTPYGAVRRPLRPAPGRSLKWGGVSSGLVSLAASGASPPARPPPLRRRAGCRRTRGPRRGR
jgi:hypothetical protein